MPLVKNIRVDPLLNGYDYRRREELLRGDYIRHIASGNCVSIRTLGITNQHSLVVQNTLQQLAEEGVAIGSTTYEAYIESQQILCQQLTRLFWKANVGVMPTRPKPHVFLGSDYKSESAFYADDTWVWFPMCAVLMGAEIVILMRVVNAGKECLNGGNSLALGMAMKDLDFVFPELAEYVSYMKNKASQDEGVGKAFRYLMQLIQPKEMAAQEARERAERYKDVQQFGTWG